VAFRAYAWVYGLAPLFVHWLVQEVLLDQVLGIRTGNAVALAGYGIAVGALAAAVIATGRGGALRGLVVDARSALVPYVVFAALCAAIAAHDVDQPIPRLKWQDVSRKTFGLQVTHDNYFQFVNGKAIAEHVPFAAFYGGGALVYPVTSRGIVPGVLYSSWRRIVGGLRPAWEDRFAWYLLFGIACNAMMVFPLDALRVRLRLRMSSWLLLGLLATSALFVVNGYYTWFKLCGAAFFLSGVVALLAPASAASWAAAGALWGLSASMHQGNALGFPIVALWALTRAGVGPLGWLRLAGAMAAAFAVVMLPWQVVMALHFPPDVLLVAGHYLDGHFGPSLEESARAFVAATPWQAQVSHRLASLVVALRALESVELLTGWTSQAIDAWVVLWPRYRFGYAAIVLYPVAIGALAARLFGPTRPAGRNSSGLLVATVLSLVAAILVHYSWWYADWIPHLPLGPLILAYVLLADRCVAWRWTHAALLAFVLVEGTITLGTLVTGTGQEPLPLRCGKPGICGHDLMLHDAESSVPGGGSRWTPLTPPRAARHGAGPPAPTLAAAVPCAGSATARPDRAAPSEPARS
jgi:hypothetical protein